MPGLFNFVFQCQNLNLSICLYYLIDRHEDIDGLLSAIVHLQH